MTSTYEVELKFRLENPEPVENIIRGHGGIERKTVTQVDRYFNHPARDFRVTDEAFRIRTVDGNNYVTYKGAVQGNVAKTRHEVEVEFTDGPDSAQRLSEMVLLLGFRFVREVRKSRRSFALSWNNADFELAIDTVPGIGCFLEIELLANADRRDAAEAAVWELARTLGLSVAEQRSYLDLLLESDGPPR